MNNRERTARPGDATPERTVADVVVRAAGAWVAQFARTLKTCRLYDPMNPAVLRFRDEFQQATARLVQEHGSVTVRFAANDVTCDGVSLYPARSRDDNLAYPFHRDGVRAITLHPGVTSSEVETLLDSVLAVTGQHLDENDLVTLLWEADLRHVDIDFIPAEGDVGGSGAAPAPPGEGTFLPWPGAEGPESAATGDAANATPGLDVPGTADAPPDTPAGAIPAPGRSEDWMLGDLTVEVEASFVELDTLAAVETARFRREFTEEHLVSPVAAALAIASACLSAQANDEDRAEMTLFLPRVLRAALGVGAWLDARDALRMLRERGAGTWSEETLLQEILQPVSIARVVERLDAQDPTGLGAFLAMAGELGDAGVDWMTLVLAESQQRDVRRVLAESIAQTCKERPERLAPWLSDGRWYVVRNIVHILGWIGGAEVAPLLQAALRHTDPRVRAQVVASLSRVELRQARPLLVRAIEGADTRLFCQILSQLSGARDAATARFVYAFLQQERFATRPPEERRAIYAALASVGGDEIVPDLEAELFKGNWFDREQELHRHNIARILARIGTPASRAVLERGAQSKRAPVRQASLMALGGSQKEAA